MPMIKELTTEDLLYNARENNKKLKQEIDKYRQALEEIRDIFDAIVNRKLQTFNEIDTAKIILAIRKKVNEVLDDRD